MSQFTQHRMAAQYAGEPVRQPVATAAGGIAGRAALPRAAGFWLVAGVLFLLFFASAAPSPLYGVYQAQWRFSATTLTAVFAVYALVLLLTLLVFGSLSDYLGRRRVILVALAASAGACGLFLAAHGVGLLFAARALQGAAVGAATSALGAALIDLQPERQQARAGGHQRRRPPGPGRGRAGHQRAGPVRAGAHPSGLVAAPRRLRRRCRGRAGDPGDRDPARPASWPRCGRGWPCRGRHAGRSRWPCRA